MRQQWIDRAKGIAMLMVIAGHINSKFSFVYGIHLVIFFVLSGYLLKKKEVTQEYINEKFKRLMVPYFYTCTAIAVADVVNCYVLQHNSSIAAVTSGLYRDIVRTFFASGAITMFGGIELGTRIGAIWFLPAMFFAVLLFQMLLKYTQSDVELILWSVGMSLVGYISAKFIWLPFSIQSALFAVVFVCIGYEVRQKKLLEQLQLKHYVLAQLVLLCGIFRGYCSIGYVTADMVDLLLSMTTGISGCVVLYGLLTQFERVKGGGIAWIGRNSLTVLCTHLYALETKGQYLYDLSTRFENTWLGQEMALVVIEIVYAVVVAALVEWIKKAIRQIEEKIQYKKSNTIRDKSVDVLRGMLILLMLAGQFAIDHGLRNVIYSFHMAAFIILSGYFYRKSGSIKENIFHLVKTFGIPYLLYSLLLLIIKLQNGGSFEKSAVDCALAMSFSRRYFPNADSMGPMYFVMLLLSVRMIYLMIDRISTNEIQRSLFVFICSIGGTVLGRKEMWLPWSLDVACYAVVFYYIGALCKKYDILKKMRESALSYYVLSVIWAYLIYCGGMELAVRNYGAQYGMAILGAVAGTVILYKWAGYIVGNLSLLAAALEKVGRASMILLALHALWGQQIRSMIGVRFNPEYFTNMVLAITIQVVAALFLDAMVQMLKVKCSI